MKQIVCQECGKDYTAKRGNARFCCSKCKVDWNNRRFARGAELYDFFMMIRYDRAAVTKDGTLQANIAKGMMEKLGELYREADKEARGGRPSWKTLKSAIHDAEIPLGRTQGVGDKR